MSAIRDKARTVLDKLPKTGEVRSDLNPDLFKTLTGGVTQTILMENWRPSTEEEKLKGRKQGYRTVCIDFVCWYAGQMGINILADIPKEKRDSKTDGFFALGATMKKDGKGYAYVTAAKDGPVPQFGDIIRHTAFHVDIALGFDGNTLLRAAGGQSSHPRPKADVSKEYDNVLRVRGSKPYDPKDLEGWLDLDLFFGGPPTADPSLTWLYGWWDVTDGNPYYYYFAPGGVVQYITTRPTTEGPPQKPGNIGRYAYTPPNQLVLNWNQVIRAEAACQETFYNAASGCQQMNATSTLYAPLVAKRM
jgi:hypothetical protein